MVELDGLADYCDDEAGYKWVLVGSGLERVVFDSEFCEVEMVNLNFWLQFGLVSILEGVDKNVCVLAVLLVVSLCLWDSVNFWS